MWFRKFRVSCPEGIAHSELLGETVLASREPTRRNIMSHTKSHIMRNRALFNLADEHLLNLVKEHVLKDQNASDAQARQVLAKYLNPVPRPQSLTGKDGIFHRLAYTAQDYGMAPSVIGKAMGGVDKLEPVLFGFDPQAVVEKYPDITHHQALLDTIVSDLKPKGKINQGPRALFPKYCRSLISGARFLSQFNTAQEFYGWVEPLERDAARRLELPRRVQQEIFGFGFALSCIFFMDIGFASLLKPDIWVIRFCNRLNIVSSEDPYLVFNAAIEFAEQVGTTPFCLDRMIWLIGTGEFWLDGVDLGSQDQRQSQRQLDDFVSFVRQREEQVRGERFVWKEGDIEIIKLGT